MADVVSARTSGLSAGAGRAEIELPASVFPVDGFGGQRDALETRVLILEQRDRRIVLAVLDQTSISPPSQASVRTLIVQLTGAAAADVVVCASHTFSAPHVVDPVGLTPEEQERNGRLQSALDDATERATRAALKGLQPARLGYGNGVAAVAVNRDVPTSAGWWLGAEPKGATDPTVRVVRIERLDATPVAFLVNYAVQSSVMNESVAADGLRLVTADLAGAASRHAERMSGGKCVALFLIGAAGDQAPLLTSVRQRVQPDGHLTSTDAGPAGELLVDLLGERLGTEAARVGAEISCHPVDTIDVVADWVVVPRQVPDPTCRSGPALSYAFPPAGEVTVPFWIVRLGPVGMVGFQAEINCRTALDIQRRSELACTLVATMVNGGAKYLADRESYERVTYEARNSWHGAGAAERVADAAVRRLNGS